MTAYRTILVPTDGSEHAERAFTEALDLAAEHDAALHLLAVVDTRRFTETARSTEELLVDDREDELNEHLATLAERAESAGVEVSTRSCHGTPDDEILAHAAAVDADVILMGERGADHALHRGTVATAVTERSSREVVTF